MTRFDIDPFFIKNNRSSAKDFKNCDQNGLLDNFEDQIAWQNVGNVVRRYDNLQFFPVSVMSILLCYTLVVPK